MLLAQKTAMWFDGMINLLIITKPIFLSSDTKVICESAEAFHIMSCQEAINKKFNILARLWFSFESNKPMLSHDSCDGLHYMHYHNTFPLFKKITYNKSTMQIGPTYNRLGKGKNFLEFFIKFHDSLTLSKKNR